jgi:hypothetical protein
MRSPDSVTAIVVFLGPVLSLVGLWLRLRYQLHGERERRRYLVTAATTLPAGSQVHDQRGDGTHLTLTVGHPAQKASPDE